jgi:type IV pilus assembly protein PilA
MNWKNASVLAAGILLGLLAAWWLGLFSRPVKSAAPAVAANPFISNSPAKVNLRQAVEAPVLPPVPASQSEPPAPITRASIPTTAEQASMEDLRQQARVKAIRNNLRQIASAALEYMLEKGVTSASYYDLIGNGTEPYIRSLNPVMGEDYTGIFVSQEDTQVMVVAPDGTTVTYDL